MSCSVPNNERSHNLSGAHDPSKDELLSFVSTGNALPILHEIKHALTALLDSGEETIIDLGAIPFMPGDERHLMEVLGVGEVSAIVDVLGETQVYETQVPGVWRVEHLDEHQQATSRFIEITFIPEILKTQREDATAGLDMLAERLDAMGGDSTGNKGA